MTGRTPEPSERPRAAVTGGAGFLGSHLVDRLVTDGHEVLVIDDLSSGRVANLAPSVRIERADIATDDLDPVVRSWRPRPSITSQRRPASPRPWRIRCAIWRSMSWAPTEWQRRLEQQGPSASCSSPPAALSTARPNAAATERTLPAPASYYGIHKLAAEAPRRVIRRVLRDRSALEHLRPASGAGPRGRRRGLLPRSSRPGWDAAHPRGRRTDPRSGPRFGCGRGVVPTRTPRRGPGRLEYRHGVGRQHPRAGRSRGSRLRSDAAALVRTATPGGHRRIEHLGSTVAWPGLASARVARGRDRRAWSRCPLDDPERWRCVGTPSPTSLPFGRDAKIGCDFRIRRQRSTGDDGDSTTIACDPPHVARSDHRRHRPRRIGRVRGGVSSPLPTYSASVTLLVTPTPTDQPISNADVQVAQALTPTFAELATTGPGPQARHRIDRRRHLPAGPGQVRVDPRPGGHEPPDDHRIAT